MTATTRPTRPVDRLQRAVGEVPLVDLVTRVSLLLQVINLREHPAAMVAVAAVVVVALGRRWHRAPALWLGLGIGTLALLAPRWEGVDDHIVATAYWAIALGLSLRGSDPERLVAWNGRLLAGLVFGFAAFWKVSSAVFADGTFFHYTLLLDGRFQYLAESIGGLSEAQYLANQVAERAMQVSMPTPEAATLIDTGRISTLAAVMTAWGILSESAAALSLLLPLRGRWERLRHLWILAFCATTYAVVPIGGFGTLLATLGLAQAGESTRLRLAYLAVFAGMLVYTPLWRALFFS